MKFLVFVFFTTGCTANFSISKDGDHRFLWKSNSCTIPLTDDLLTRDDLHDIKQSDFSDIVQDR